MLRLAFVRRALALSCALVVVAIVVALPRAARLERLTPPSSSSAPAAPPPAPPRWPAGREELVLDERHRVHVYPPAETARATAAPLVLMLHGMCGDPLRACEFWSDEGRAAGWLVCPAGNGSCGPDQPDWQGSGAVKAAYLDGVSAAVRRAHPGLVAGAGADVVVGYSRGAFVARDVVYERPGVFSGAVLLAAAVDPDPRRFAKNGIRRVLLAAGDFDGARPTMRRAAAKLSAAGLPARFIGLGPMGHGLPADLGERLAPWLAWVRGGPEP